MIMKRGILLIFAICLLLAGCAGAQNGDSPATIATTEAAPTEASRTIYPLPDTTIDQTAVSKTILGTKTITGYTGSGLANVYTHQADVTFGEMDEAFATVAQELTHSTIRELLDLGLLNKLSSGKCKLKTQ